MQILNQIGTFLIGVFVVFISISGMILLLAMLWAIPTMLLWDWLMPEIFGLTTITIWQAMGVNILAGIFFKSKANAKANAKAKAQEKDKKNIILG